MASTRNDTRRADRLRHRLAEEVRHRDEGRAQVEAANAELGRIFAEAIESELGILKELAEEAGVSRTTAYAMAEQREGAR
jgi:hypothetical protein